VNTFDILLACLPFFLAVGSGLYYVLAAIFPFWRSPGWNHWKTYDMRDGCGMGQNSYKTYLGNSSPRSLLVALGFRKAPKVLREGDYSLRQAMLIGVVLILFGIAGIIWVVHTSLNS